MDRRRIAITGATGFVGSRVTSLLESDGHEVTVANGGQAGIDAAQDLFDTYVLALDHALRELGVGDLSIAKKMRKLGESLYGRMAAYEGPLRADDVDGLAEALARNVFEDAASPAARDLADYAVRSRASLAARPASDLKEQPRWAEIRP